MKKLISVLVATAFAVSSGVALAASHVGAQPTKDSKSEMKKSDKKAKKSSKKAAKKDEMKK